MNISIQFWTTSCPASISMTPRGSLEFMDMKFAESAVVLPAVCAGCVGEPRNPDTPIGVVEVVMEVDAADLIMET